MMSDSKSGQFSGMSKTSTNLPVLRAVDNINTHSPSLYSRRGYIQQAPSNVYDSKANDSIEEKQDERTNGVEREHGMIKVQIKESLLGDKGSEINRGPDLAEQFPLTVIEGVPSNGDDSDCIGYHNILSRCDTSDYSLQAARGESQRRYTTASTSSEIERVGIDSTSHRPAVRTVSFFNLPPPPGDLKDRKDSATSAVFGAEHNDNDSESDRDVVDRYNTRSRYDTSDYSFSLSSGVDSDSQLSRESLELQEEQLRRHQSRPKRGKLSAKRSFHSMDWFGPRGFFTVGSAYDDECFAGRFSRGEGELEGGEGAMDKEMEGRRPTIDKALSGSGDNSRHYPDADVRDVARRRTVLGLGTLYAPAGAGTAGPHTENSHHKGARPSLNLASLGSKTEASPSEVFSAQFDYVIVFPCVSAKKKKKKREGRAAATTEKGGVDATTAVQSPDAKYVIHTLIQAGLEVYPYLSLQRNELIVLFRAPLPVLKTIAEKSDFKMLMDPEALREALLRGNPERKIAPIRIRHDPTITPLTPYEHIYLRFQEENPMSWYYRMPGNTHPFCRSVRLKLIHFLINAPKRFGGCDMHLSSMIHHGSVKCMFPLHDARKCSELLQACLPLGVMPWQYPVDGLKEYLGEKIALYTVFMGHLSYWLILPAAIGLGLQVIVLQSGDFSHPSLLFYCVLMSVWAVFMLEYWKREEYRTAMRWGMIDYVSRESDRPEFRGQPNAYSHIDGKEMLYFPPTEYRQRVVFSICVILAFLMLVVGVIACIYVLRFSLQKDIGFYASGVSSCLNVLQITSFNLAYQTIAVRLNNLENHRTETQYEDALIAKVFTFQFINSYASYFFLAFVAANLNSNHGASTDAGECGYRNCMRPLSLNLVIIFVARITAKNVLDLLVPYVKCVLKIRSETRGIEAAVMSDGRSKLLTPAELDYMLMDYDSTLESIRIYADSAVQYGFMQLFVVALPGATLLGLLNNYIKMKFNVWKILTLYQRPIPTGTENIKSWQTIFRLISNAAVVTNAGLVCFTMDVLNGYSLQGRVWIFIGFQWALFSMQFLVVLLVPSEPEEVRIQRARMACIAEKLVDKYEDDDYGVEIQYYESDSSDEENEGEGDEENGFKRWSKDRDRERGGDPHGVGVSGGNGIGALTKEKSLKRHDTNLAGKQQKKRGWADWFWRRGKKSGGGGVFFSPSRSFGMSSLSFVASANRGGHHVSITGSRHHKRIYGNSLPSVPVLDYPVTDDRAKWPRPVDKGRAGGDDMDYDILKLNI